MPDAIDWSAARLVRGKLGKYVDARTLPNGSEKLTFQVGEPQDRGPWTNFEVTLFRTKASGEETYSPAAWANLTALLTGLCEASAWVAVRGIPSTRTYHSAKSGETKTQDTLDFPELFLPAASRVGGSGGGVPVTPGFARKIPAPAPLADGRADGITPEQLDRIVALVKQGAPDCRFAGVAAHWRKAKRPAYGDQRINECFTAADADELIADFYPHAAAMGVITRTELAAIQHDAGEIEATIFYLTAANLQPELRAVRSAIAAALDTASAKVGKPITDTNWATAQGYLDVAQIARLRGTVATIAESEAQVTSAPTPTLFPADVSL